MCSVKPSENHRYQIREKLNHKKSVFGHFSCRAYPPLVSIGSPLDSGQNRKLNTSHSLRKKCPYSEFFGPHFPAFGLNTERYSVSLRIQSECGKIPTRITSNTGTFYAVISFSFYFFSRTLLPQISRHHS